MVKEVIIPVLDQTGDEVTITQWLKNEGDEIDEGETLCEVETSKANTEIVANTSGILRRIMIEAGTAIPSLTVIALIAHADEPLPNIDPYYRVQQLELQQSAPTHTRPKSGSKRVLPFRRTSKNRVVASPRAKRLAAKHDIDLSTLSGTGTGGRIVEDDVLQVIEQASTLVADRATQIKAERVSQSWQTIPHFYTMITVDMSFVVKKKSQAGSEITYTDFFVQAIAQTLKDHLVLNGHWENGRLKISKEIHLGLVVQTERGLIIPVLRDLKNRSFEDIVATRTRLVQQSHGGKLDAVAMGDATFTLSNLGAGHIDHFTAIIAPPQVAILSVGSIQPRPCVIGSELTVRPTATFTIGVDHRAIDGRQAADFLEALKRNLEQG